MSLSLEKEAAYGAIIDQILSKADLTSVSAKQVRKELGNRLGYDISHQKDAVNLLIGQHFDKINSQKDATNGTAEPPPTANGSVVKSIEQPPTPLSPGVRSVETTPPKRSAPADEDSELSDPIDEPKPKKKQKRVTAEEDDAAFAARLQDEENRRARPTRGGATRKRAPVKKDKNAVKKKKSATKIKADDDSDVESGDEAPKERKGGFHKPMVLSQPLAELVGEPVLSRPQTVKHVWKYIKANDLQDPSDKRQIICDEMMRRVFKSDKVHMFTMNKILGPQMYAQDE